MISLVGKFECHTCRIITPFTYAKCLNGIIDDKKPTICEIREGGVILNARKRLGGNRKLSDVLREILTNEAATKKELILLIPEYSGGSIGYTLSMMPDVKATRVKGKKWFIYSICRDIQL